MTAYTDSYDSQFAAIVLALDASTTGKVQYARVDKYTEALLHDLVAQEHVLITPISSTTWEITALSALWETIDFQIENPQPEE